jgi:hypothetical protein
VLLAAQVAAGQHRIGGQRWVVIHQPHRAPEVPALLEHRHVRCRLAAVAARVDHRAVGRDPDLFADTVEDDLLAICRLPPISLVGQHSHPRARRQEGGHRSYTQALQRRQVFGAAAAATATMQVAKNE